MAASITKSWIPGIAAVMIIGVIAAGCTQQSGDGQKSSLNVIGSTTVLPIAQKTADAYMNDHKNTDIQVTAGGSAVGIQATGEKTADIGMSSRELKPEEKARYPNLQTTVVASEGIAIIVNKANTVNGLTLAQLRGIYNGTITNWKAFGGPDMVIVVVGRDSASGTRDFFWESVMKKENFTATQLEKNSNGAIRLTIVQTPGAIGYVGLGYVDAELNAVPIMVNGTPVSATVGTVISGKYPISRPLLMITQGPPSGLAKSYLDFIVSPAGRKIVTDEGLVPVA